MEKILKKKYFEKCLRKKFGNCYRKNLAAVRRGAGVADLVGWAGLTSAGWAGWAGWLELGCLGWLGWPGWLGWAGCWAGLGCAGLSWARQRVSCLGCLRELSRLG